MQFELYGKTSMRTNPMEPLNIIRTTTARHSIGTSMDFGLTGYIHPRYRHDI